MSKWNCRKGELFIPDKDTPQTYACKVCGSKIVPRKANRYTVVDRVTAGGIANAMTGTYTEPEMYDAFDCPVCGCQMIAKKRLKKVFDCDAFLQN